MVIHIFQCYSFNMSFPLLPPLGPHVCSLCLHLQCYPANTFISIIFLGSHTHVNIQYLFFHFWLISHCITGSRFIHLIRTDSNAFLCWAIFYCIYVTQFLYPFICWWTSKLLLCPSYCKSCCNGHWGTCVSFKLWSVLENVPRALEKKVKPTIFGWNIL